MTEKKSLGGGKKVEGAGTNLDRSEGPEGAKTGTIWRAPTVRESTN